MTTRSGIVRVALSLAFLLSAFCAWADNLPSLRPVPRDPLSVEALPMGSDAGIGSDDEADDAQGDDSGSTYPLIYGLSAGTYLLPPTAEGGIGRHSDRTPSSDYHRRIFRPPIS